MAVALDAPVELHPQVALRPEPFGALAYHYGNRRLVFLKSPDVVAVVRALGDHATVADAARRRAGSTSAAGRRSWPPSPPSNDSEVVRGR